MYSGAGGMERFAQPYWTQNGDMSIPLATSTASILPIMSAQLDTLVVTRPIPAKLLDKLRAAFKTLHYHPDAVVPRDVCRETDVWFNPYFALPEGITLDDVPRTRLIQLDAGALSCAGARGEQG
jgi:hypothetical protein